MELSFAGADDLDQVAKLVNRAYRSVATSDWTSEVGLIAGPRTSRQALAGSIENGASIILLAKAAVTGELCGCVALSPLADAQWYLSMLAVSPQYQSAGVGKSILSGAESYAQNAGARSLTISVINLRHRLIEWDERRGFVRTGQTEPFPYDHLGESVALRRDLVLVSLSKSLG